MNTTAPVTQMLVIDFSGTLSLEAVLFAGNDNLLRELKESGLWRLGIDTPETFWEAIVNPTWKEGSTTAKGYTRVMFEQLRRMTTTSEPPIPEQTIWTAASQFVDRYLAASVIDPAWKSLFQRFDDQPEVLVVIATDHYAEATEQIRQQLKTLGFEGGSFKGGSFDGGSFVQRPSSQAAGMPSLAPTTLFIANSADLGYPKSVEGFWKRMKSALALNSISNIVILDDFGYNEQSADRYSRPEKIDARMEQTLAMLTGVFNNAHVEAFPFFVDLQADDLYAEYRSKIQAAEAFAVRTLRD